MNRLRASLFVFVLILSFVFGLFVRDLMRTKTTTGDAGYLITEDPVATVPTEDPVVMPPNNSLVEYRMAETKEALTINWISPPMQPVVPVDDSLFTAFCPQQDPSTIDPGMGPAPTYNLCGDPPSYVAYRLGTVRAGTYKDRNLVAATFVQPGLGTTFQTAYYLEDPSGAERPVLIDQYGAWTNEFLFGGKAHSSVKDTLGQNAQISAYIPDVTIDTGLTIPDLDFTPQLEDSQGRSYRFIGYWSRFDDQKATNLLSSKESIPLKDGRILYRYLPSVLPAEQVPGSDSFLMIDEDGRLLAYDLVIPFFTYGDQLSDPYGYLTKGRPVITWKDGTKNSKDYIKAKFGGCGYADTTHVVPESVMATLPDMQAAGTAYSLDGLSSTAIFEPTSYDADYYKSLLNIVTYDDGYQSESPDAKEYSDFAHAYIYFQDSFGRWVEMSSNDLVPPVECGKPVIYLYPEAPTDLTVSLAPQGGFSYTEPVYQNGWRITAYPDGHLVNKDDGQTYPYLFWEGRGGRYQSPTTSWVMEQSQVESFLRETLAAMNLNTQETNDFVEFWLPRMQDAPYYRIGFHGTSVMDQLAPLSLSVKADHTFRFLMDYEPLQENAPSNPPLRLPRANRDGFEVIEWGGVLR